jgi:hypothetical protein
VGKWSPGQNGIHCVEASKRILLQRLVDRSTKNSEHDPLVTRPCEDLLTTHSSLSVKYSLSLPIHNVDRSSVVAVGVPSDAGETLNDQGNAEQSKLT